MDIRCELFLFIDRIQFEKVIDNLLINAVEACSNCEKPFIKVSIDEKDVYGIITTEDNGSGIDTSDATENEADIFASGAAYSDCFTHSKDHR